MIPYDLPYDKFCRDKIDVDNITWFDYIVGEFSGEKWWNRDDVDTSKIDRANYYPMRFREQYTHLHNRFFEALESEGHFDDLPFNHAQNFESEPVFHIDLHCRFDIWTLYNQPNRDVVLNCGGNIHIETRPQQKEITDVPCLTDTVPPDVPLIYGPPQLSQPESTRPYGLQTMPTSQSRI